MQTNPHTTRAESDEFPNTQPSYLQAAMPGGGMQLAHWDLLFSAVNDRLRGIVDATAALEVLPQSQHQLFQLQTAVLDCVDALERLHQAHLAVPNDHG